MLDKKEKSSTLNSIGPLEVERPVSISRMDTNITRHDEAAQTKYSRAPVGSTRVRVANTLCRR